jgi:hypothetical protein
MTDLVQLSNDLASSLAPFIPYLLDLGKRAGEEAAVRFGAEAWGWAKTVWDRLADRLPEPQARSAIEQLSRQPDSSEARVVLAWELRGILEEDTTLAQSLHQLLQQQPQQIQSIVIANASGERSIAVGGNVEGSAATGDQLPDAD